MKWLPVVLSLVLLGVCCGWLYYTIQLSRQIKRMAAMARKLQALLEKQDTTP
jgi:uncharacterized membrane protein YpjA